MVRLSIGADLIWKIAASETAHNKHEFIEKEQLLIGICSLEKTLIPGIFGEDLEPKVLQGLEVENDEINEILHHFEIEQTKLRRSLREKVGIGYFDPQEKVIHRSENCKEYFNRAAKIVENQGYLEVYCIHFLEAIMENPGILIKEVLEEFGVKPENIIKAILNKKELTERRGYATPFLDKFGTDLTLLVKEKGFDPLIGRRDELLQVIRTLTRKKKNNPLIIGDAGVGKTAIVRGLAQRIVDGKVTPALKNKRIFELTMSSLVAGACCRGDFEDRLNGIIQEMKYNPNIIVFIDEIHTMIGAGGGNLDAANIMKPALAQGEVSCIGATTYSEYRKYFEKDSALERRFQPIRVEEPSVEDTILILKGLKKDYEKYHHVKIGESTIRVAVELSARYLPDRRLPDKAFDLLDEACSRKKVPELTMRGDIDESFGKVDDGDIAEVLEEWTGIPVKIDADERDKLLNMEEELKKRVIGQDEAITKVSKKIKIARSGIQDSDRPYGVFLFLGPTGVGKTELAKALASFLFYSDKAIIRLDMSEYMEKHMVSKLIGSPPGYKDSEEEGHLTGALRRNPYSVVLIDEIEKAHPKVFDIFLQIFDDGRITDAKGRTVDAKNAIFIMTSNIQPADKGFEAAYGIHDDPELGTQKIMEDLKGYFKPEFINRIDEIISFKYLQKNEVRMITNIMLNELTKKLLKMGINLELDIKVVNYISNIGYDENFGARPLKRTIARKLEEPLSEKIISGELVEGDNIVVEMVEDEISIKIKKIGYT